MYATSSKREVSKHSNIPSNALKRISVLCTEQTGETQEADQEAGQTESPTEGQLPEHRPRCNREGLKKANSWKKEICCNRRKYSASLSRES